MSKIKKTQSSTALKRAAASVEETAYVSPDVAEAMAGEPVSFTVEIASE